MHARIFSALVVFLLQLNLAGALRAADPLALELIAADDSLAGWQYGPDAPRGWTVREGTFVASAEATPLIGGWSFGDFELAFAWTGNWHLGLLPVGDGQPWEIALGEGEGETWIDAAGDHAVAKQAVAALPDGAPHRAIVRRFGARLMLEVDGRRAVSCAVDDSLRVPRLAGQGELHGLVLDEPLGEPLFNGRDTAGWKVTSGRMWRVADGELHGGGGSNYLRTEAEFENFVFALEYKQSTGGNSGVGIRTPDGGWPSGDGMELQLYDEPLSTPLNKHSTAAIYGNMEPLARADRPDVWNRVVVRAQGRLISMWVNGRLVQHADTRLCPELKYRRLRGWVGVQNHQDPSRMRNILLRQLPDGEGPDDWRRARPEPASRRALEPWMNSQRLAEQGVAVGSSRAIQAAAGESQAVELAGPGAITALCGAATEGRVVIEIDGAAAIDCALSELSERVHAIAAAPAQLACYVPFRRAARCTFTALGTPLNLRLDHVAAPENTVPESWGDGAACERGLHSALAYRRQQLESGRHREGDEVQVVEMKQESLEPGAQLSVEFQEQSGVVVRTTLGAPLQFLRDDALWAEVYVDGESTPALAAPARWLFPGATTSKYVNFVVTEDQGLVSLLGMPFATGLRLVITNRGDEAVRNVRLHLAADGESWRTAPAIEPGLRLRGVFHRHDDAAPLALAGRGCLVGLIAEPLPDAGGPPRVAQMRVDGQPAVDGELDSLAFWGLAAAEGDQLGPFAGRAGPMIWRWFLPAPPAFEREFTLDWCADAGPCDCLLLYYGRP
ncbi:MAG: DUF1080 domain-containing protein [Pirellulales bacterium]|nr:DUF1080 domain-containing protein [Pirellulales bacterium]